MWCILTREAGFCLPLRNIRTQTLKNLSVNLPPTKEWHAQRVNKGRIAKDGKITWRC